MPDRSSPQAEAVYRRAVSAYQRGAYEEAHRLAREALTFDPAHDAATALVRRLGVRETGPQVVSTDPTVLISGGGDTSGPESVDPTIVVPRNMPRTTVPPTPRPPVSPPSRSTRGRAADPTVIVDPGPDPHSGRVPSTGRASVWQRLRGSGGPPPPRSSTTGSASIWTPGRRGLLIVLGSVVVAALCVWGAVRAVHWFSPAGEALTVDMAEGGRIEGGGIRCGAGATKCSITVPTNGEIQLTAKAADGYEFAGFTGDCEANIGRLLMDRPKNCGARFEPRSSPPPSATYTLTIQKPAGGTITAPAVGGNIECGELGSVCTGQVPAGEPVKLTYLAADGHEFDSFFAECAGGEFVMNAPRTCGAVFRPSAAPLNNPTFTSGPTRPPRARDERPPAGPVTGTTTPPPPPPPLPERPTAPLTPDVPSGGVQQGAPPGATLPQEKPAPPPPSLAEEAKRQIEQLVRDYCDELETLKPERIRKLFSADNQQQYMASLKEYKSLDCTLTGTPDVSSLDVEGGIAKVKFEMKQTIRMKIGGAPATNETTVLMIVSRRSLRSEWLIQGFDPTSKPK